MGIAMNDERILHAYRVCYEDGTDEIKYTTGEIVKVEGGFLVSGKLNPNIKYAFRIELYDKSYRKPIPAKVRKAVYEKYGGRCAYCGKPLEPRQMRVDHIAAKCFGGSDDLENLYPSCTDCNGIKSNGTIEQLRETVSHFMDTIKKDVRYRMLLSYGLIEETPHEIEFLFEKSK